MMSSLSVGSNGCVSPSLLREVVAVGTGTPLLEEAGLYRSALSRPIILQVCGDFIASMREAGDERQAGGAVLCCAAW